MSKSILIVDDSSTVLMSVDAMLSKLGFQVEKAKDGIEAETKLKGGLKVNLIITDINMPRMDGIELISKIRAIASYRFTPILVLTTEQEQAKRNEARSKGATGYLVKPVTGEQLKAVIQQVLPGSIS
ncbi:response regulator [Vibrio metoecus]|uniref:Chemotaxis protein CheY n=2 Tax=Vibrio metoecus TaxID=1481663 RepID=A0A0Q0MXC0_VIBMT|nr:response regulator [Vibrio metoecus]KQA22114.1 chemotaxis protein CheY [Vibrio metoecus]KQA24572.1 chemotaxis protein CheY [Vibrio metoecus]KQA28001.1 chemotaxis protein CheY [Vibrio metoecus]KQB10102.1 chemotaxis protein CheY [Vibrio metoecus]PAR22146.1 response regulator [Vibrio metoecus]